jgi:hypothetical protein
VFRFSCGYSLDQREIEDYEKLIHRFAIPRTLFDVVFLDCGADIDVFSARLLRTSRVTRHRFRAESRRCGIFMKLFVPTGFHREHHQGGRLFQGKGLKAPDYDNSDHARFLVPGDGP